MKLKDGYSKWVASGSTGNDNYLLTAGGGYIDKYVGIRNYCSDVTDEYRTQSWAQYYLILSSINMYDFPEEILDGEIMTYFVYVDNTSGTLPVNIRWLKYNSSSDRTGGNGALLAVGELGWLSINLTIDKSYKQLDLMLNHNGTATSTVRYKRVSLVKGPVLKTYWTFNPKAFVDTYTNQIINGLKVITKDLGYNLADWNTGQHSGPFEVGRAKNAMRVAIGVTDDNYGYIQSKGYGITSIGNLVLNPAGGGLYYSNLLFPILHSSNYTTYTVKKDGTGASGIWGINISGNADTVDNVHLEWVGSQEASSTPWLAGWNSDGTKIKAVSQANLSVKNAQALGDGTMNLYALYTNEINFGGSAENSTIYFGYRATDSKPIPTEFVFGRGLASLTSGSITVGGSIFLDTGDATLKVYSGQVSDAKSDGSVCFLTCIDNLDGETHLYSVDYPTRNNIILLPRGGQVYIGHNPGDSPTANYKLNVGGKVYATGYCTETNDRYKLLRSDGGFATFTWSGQSGLPNWVWGGNSIDTYYIYNPANFKVALAAKLGDSTVGAPNRPIYLSSGSPAAITSFGEAFLSWGGLNFSGGFGPIDAAMIPTLGANRLAFVNPDKVSVEYSTDSGVTWTDYVATNEQKTALFCGVGNTNLYIGKSSAKEIDKTAYLVRITLTTKDASVYTTLKKFAVYVSTNGSSGCYCTITARLQSNIDSNVNTWKTFANKINMSGWAGWNIINLTDEGLTTYGNNAPSLYGQIRFTFGVESHASTVQYGGLVVYYILGFGGMGHITPSNMARFGTIYAYDTSQRVTFPASVTSTGFIKSSSSDSYVLLGGGGHKALSDFVAANGGTSTNSNYLTIHDVRGTNHLPNSDIYPQNYLTAWFNKTGTPSSSWHSGITVKGWTNDYATWLLCSSSESGVGTSHNLYFRHGINDTWGNWKTILDSSNTYINNDTITINGTSITPLISRGYIGTTKVQADSAVLNLTGIGTAEFSGDITLSLTNTDRFINLKYTNTGYNWRIGNLGSGSGDANYFVIQSDKTGTTYYDALKIGCTSLKTWLGGELNVNGLVEATNFKSTVASGTQPYACKSTTLNTNLNADQLDGKHASEFSYNITSGNHDCNNLPHGTHSATYRFGASPINAFPNASYGNLLVIGSGLDTMTQIGAAYYTDALYFRRGTWYSDGSGTINNNAWKTILHDGNSSVSGGGSTWGSSITVNIGGTSKTLTIPTTFSGYYINPIDLGTLYKHTQSFTDTTNAVWYIKVVFDTKYNTNSIKFTVLPNYNNTLGRVYFTIDSYTADRGITVKTSHYNGNNCTGYYYERISEYDTLWLQFTGNASATATLYSTYDVKSWEIATPSGITFVPLTYNELLTNYNIKATKLIKSDSSDSYVLLGGGGHKALSTLQSEYDSRYDSRYVNASGDTMTGQLTISSIEHPSGIAYGGAIELREKGNVNATQTDWEYSPAISFHWSYRSIKRLGMDYLGNLKWDDSLIYHAGNLTKSTLGLGNVDNTADADKNVNSATKLKYQALLTTLEAIDNFLEASVLKVATFKTTELNSIGMADYDGMLLSIPWNSTTYGALVAIDDTTSGSIKVRGKSNDSWGSWYSLLHNGNSSVSKSGETLSVKINGTEQSLTNTTYSAGTGLSLNGTTFNINAGNEFPVGDSNLTDGTLILTSYASNSGFDDTNAVGTVYKRKASCIYGYIKGKLDSVYQAKGSYLTSHQTIYNLTLLAGTFSATTYTPNGSAKTVNIPTHTSHITNDSGFITNATLSNYLPLAGGAMTSGARISASGGNLYVGNSDNAGWLYLQDCASLSSISNWTIRTNGNAAFTNVNLTQSLTLTNTSGSYNGIIFNFDSTVGTHIYQTYDSSNSYYSLTINGNIFIGGSGKGNLNVNGILQAQGGKFSTNSSGVYWSSDRRLKDNINSARNLNIDSLIKEFDWKDTGKHSWGFIALELLEVLPEAVNYNEDNDRYSVNYDVAHSAAIASLNAKIKLLELRIKELEDGKASNE